jgi:hypothetical protein
MIQWVSKQLVDEHETDHVPGKHIAYIHLCHRWLLITSDSLCGLSAQLRVFLQ